MNARALILIPFVLVFSCGPGLIFLRTLRWSPLEKIAGSIALSLTLLGGLTFAAYWTGLPSGSSFAVTAIAGALTLAALPDWRRLLRSPGVRRTIAPFGLLVAWTLGAQSVIRHYSGGDWCCDWVEHYQRTLFFLERWPKDSLFINRYLVTARPPLMNILCAYFLGNVGKEFAFYQIVFSLLSVLVYFPCCLFARMFAPRGKRLPLLVALFLAFNPTFVVNTTFTWTKALAAFFVVLAVWLYLAGWRKHDTMRMSASFFCLAAGWLVHFSVGPYALFLAAAYMTTIWPWRTRRARDLAIVALPAAALMAVWLVWSLVDYGATATFMANSTVEDTSRFGLAENLERIAVNVFHTFRPYLWPGGLDDTPIRLLTDRSFTFYQENFWGAVGVINAFVAAGLVARALGSAGSGLSRRERVFWATFVPFTLVVGIAVIGLPSPSGLANICLQPLTYLAVTLVAARYATLNRGIRLLVWCGLVADFVLGVALEIYMESKMQMWARTPNWDWKEQQHLVFLGDTLRRSAPSIEIALALAAACAFLYLGRFLIAGEMPINLDRRRRSSVTAG